MSDELKFGMDKAPSLLKWLTDLDNNPKSHTESWCDGWNAATNNLAQENADLTAKLAVATEWTYCEDRLPERKDGWNHTDEVLV